MSKVFVFSIRIGFRSLIYDNFYEKKVLCVDDNKEVGCLIFGQNRRCRYREPV